METRNLIREEARSASPEWTESEETRKLIREEARSASPKWTESEETQSGKNRYRADLHKFGCRIKSKKDRGSYDHGVLSERPGMAAF